jgi:hypothetical protein
VFLTCVLFISALSISSVSAFYSISGLAAIFPGAIIPVIVLGVVLEIGKLAAVGFLHSHWRTAPFLIKTYLIMAILVLMFLNSIGIFGLLSKAHIIQEASNTSQSSTIQLTLEKIENEKASIANDDTQIGIIDKAVSKLTETGRAGTALQQSIAQRKSRDLLTKDKLAHQSTLNDLNSQRVEKEASNRSLEADFGPLTYLADFVYGKADATQLENVVRWIITIIVFVTDPLAIILLVSASFSLTRRKEPLTLLPNTGILHLDNDFMKD